MNFIKIYERTNEYESDIHLSIIVDVQNLTEEEYNSLDNYLDEATESQVTNQLYIEGVTTYSIKNTGEFLEDMPLPDGTIILTKEFKENGRYVIVLGRVESIEEIKVGLYL